MKSILFLLVGLAFLIPTQAASLVATYAFNDSLAAQENGVASLAAINPLGSNNFETATVYGQTRQVYHWVGEGLNMAGLSLNTSGLIGSNNYSVELVFQFVERDSAWRRVFDVQNQSTDAGFYVSPSNKLRLYPDNTEGSTTWTNGVYHHLVLTNSSSSLVQAYLNGSSQWSVSSSTMNISTNWMKFFIDDGGEVSDGRVALIRVYNGVLTSSEVTTLAQSPFSNLSPTVPEPSTLILFLVMSLAVFAFQK